MPRQGAGRFPGQRWGMFAVMVDDLRQSAYAWPLLYTSYNLNQLPYAYPPLVFYLGRIFADLTGFSALGAARWLPAFFSTLAGGSLPHQNHRFSSLGWHRFNAWKQRGFKGLPAR